jgi:hypothetical protein
MSDTPPTPETPKQRLVNEYEDPHYHDEDEAALVEDPEQHGDTKPPPRRKPVYRPRRRFYEE